MQVNARLRAAQARDYAYILTLPDKQLLRATSTSPEHEAARYADNVRAALSWLLDGAARAGPQQAAPAYFVWEVGCRAWVGCSKPPALHEAGRSCPDLVTL